MLFTDHRLYILEPPLYLEAMRVPSSAKQRALEDKAFLLLLIAISLAFGWLLSPFYEAVFWGMVLAILFTPLYRRISQSMRQKRTLAALATVTIILVVVILPLTLITALLLQEGASVFARIQSGELSFGGYFQRLFAAFPSWLTDLLARFGLGNPDAVHEKMVASLTTGSKFIAGQAFNLGQNTFNFVISFFIMLYLLFFLLRDGEALSERIRRALPLQAEQQRNLSSKFTIVIRATMKGNIAMAVVQGTLGGLAFWFLGIHAAVLWGAIMAFLSLLPAIGAALIWLPAAVYLLVTGATWQGIALLAYGVLVISMVDNILRPLLVGKDTQMPDYVVLISTLGGIAVFGVSGFVIGPVIAAMFMAAWDIFSTARSETGD